jgi:hypothetical protein
MPYSPEQTHDDEHLKLLAIFHYVLGGLGFLGALGGAFYMLAGFFVFQKMPTPGPAHGSPPVEIGWLFVIIGGFVALLSIAYGICLILAARSLTMRRNRTFCMVMAGINCLHFPLGTLLGVFTFIVLIRPSVVARFERPN